MWINREISGKLIDLARLYPAVVLTGARQVGKTSLLKRLFPKHSFVSLDLPSNAQMAESMPADFLKKYPPPVLIDEVQYAPSLFRYIKIEIEKDRDNYGQYIFTGSQKFTLMKSISDSLAGRCVVCELEGLSVHELSNWVTAGDLPAIMVRGGYPELHARAELSSKIFFDSYIATYLERDVRSLLNVGQLRDFERFLRACALRSGQTLNKSELARDVGISATTANEWLSVLHASNQVLLLESWFSNKTKSLVKSPKLYIADSGLLCALLNIENADELIDSPMIGAIWETFVFSEMRKRSLGSWDIWYWRDKYGLEVDFLIHKGGTYKLSEAKWSENPTDRDASSLNKVANILGKAKVRQMKIISRATSSYKLLPSEVTVTGLWDV